MEPNVVIKISALDETKAAFASLKNSVKGIQNSTIGLKTHIETLAPVFRTMSVAGAAAFAGISALANQSINAYAEVERSQRQLTHAIVDVSKGTKEQVAEVNALTAALEKKAGVDADSVNFGVAQLSTFGLQSKSVIALTKSLADLTVNQAGVNAGSEDYIQSANNIAKALNGQFGVLEKMGIRFTEAQQNLILYGKESQKVSAIQEGFAQNLRETTDTVSGVDLASAKMKRTLENINENLGRALVPAFAKLAETIQPIIEKIADWAEANPELFAKIVMVTGAIAGLVTVIGVIGLALPPIITGFSVLAGAIGLISLPVLAVGAAIAALVAAVYYLWKNWDSISVWMVEKWEAMKLGVTVVMESLAAFFGAVWEGIKTVFWTAINFIIGSYAQLFDFLLPGWQGMFAEMLASAQAILASIGAFLSSSWAAITSAFSAAMSVIGPIWSNVWNAAKSTFETLWGAITSIFDAAIDGIKKGMETLTKPIQKVIDMAERAYELAGGAIKSAGNFVSSSVSSILDRGSSITGKAVGGSVYRNTPYIVGEAGPELFVPGISGNIVPNGNLMGAMGGGASFNVTISNNSFMGEKDMAEKVGDQIIKLFKQNGRI
jgi:hypothetical protein